MRLIDYLRQKNIRQDEFAWSIGISQHWLYLWLLGRAKPNKGAILRIQQETGGAVTESDWEGGAPDSNGAANGNAPVVRRHQEVAEQAGLRLSTPLQEAMSEFGLALRYRADRQVFEMAGRVYTAKQLITHANKKRFARGAQPISYPGVPVVFKKEAEALARGQKKIFKGGVA